MSKKYTNVTLNNKRYYYREYGNRHGRYLEIAAEDASYRVKKVTMKLFNREEVKLDEAAKILERGNR